jgi:AbrB family looped-hinge helix DNA binding protein
METMEVTVAERGQIVIPKPARDAMGITPGTKLELRVVQGQLIVTKRVSLNLAKWVGSALDDGKTTEQALQELRGRPVPWTGSARDRRLLALPHADAVAELAKARSRKAVPRAAPARKAAAGTDAKTHPKPRVDRKGRT